MSWKFYARVFKLGSNPCAGAPQKVLRALFKQGSLKSRQALERNVSKTVNQLSRR